MKRHGNTSDPYQLTCKCDPKDGMVLLFYKYITLVDVESFAKEQKEWCQMLGLTGKVRVASEGFNITVAGSNRACVEYMNRLSRHPVLEADQLTDIKAKQRFFKPTPGCVHAFRELLVRTVDEICSLNVPRWQPQTMRYLKSDENTTIEGVTPEEFHRHVNDIASLPSEAAYEQHDTVLLDTRNYYESQVGHFENSICPPIRKFSSLPAWLQEHRNLVKGKTVLTYCTGGIRCEKISAYIQEHMDVKKVKMLDGGIHSYIDWMDRLDKEECRDDRQHSSLFRGRNYVFDARQSLGSFSFELKSDEGNSVTSSRVKSEDDTVAICRFCKKHPVVFYTKCIARGCHLLLAVCDDCKQSRQITRQVGVSQEAGVYCCKECQSMDSRNVIKRHLCECEIERRLRWSESRPRPIDNKR